MSTAVLGRASAPATVMKPGRAARNRGRLLLVLGIALTALTGLRWNVAILAWVAPVPFMLYVREHGHWRGRATLLLALVVAHNLQWAKLITAPIPALLAPAYAVPIAVAAWGALLAWDAIRRRAGEGWAIYAYAAVVALLEVLAYRGTAWGVWATASSTQTENLPLLQLASLTGVSGIGFLMAWVASATTATISAPRPSRQPWHVGALLVAVTVVFTWGSVRLFTTSTDDTVRVAGVVADLGPGPDGLPSGAALAANTDQLFARSVAAAEAGARLVVWNEAATVVDRADEAAFIARGATIARSHDVDLVLAYIVPLSTDPLRFENKYTWLSQTGDVLETYFKHHPVPGEGSVRGAEPLRIHERPYGVAAGAICYDYDFPAMGLEHARLGAGLVVVPSSDWKGIDPYHTHMARIRAIEGGFSLLRPVRWATSGAFDAYGRTRATLSHFEENDRVILATLPVEPVRTVYAATGELPVLAYILIVLLAVGAAVRRKGTIADA